MIARTDIAAPFEATASWPRRLASMALDLLFPPHCVACHRVGDWFCLGCRTKVEAIEPPVCTLCGSPSLPGLQATPVRQSGDMRACVSCRRQPPHLDGIRSYAFHSEPLRTAIHRLKYEDVRVLSTSLGDLMSRAWLTHYGTDVHVDVIIPVPLHARRERDRGYNQSALLAGRLAFRLGLPMLKDALVRTRHTLPQVGLDADQRHSNVQGAFRAREGRVSGRHILLVDDVLTSGATLAACCGALRDAGASAVWAYTLARART